MKLICKYSSTIINGKPSKPVQAQIGFCQKNDMLQLHVVSNAKKEKICVTSTNVKEIHDKFKKKGKATIVFKNPNYTVMLSEASPIELDKALKVIKIVARGGKSENVNIEISAIVPTMKKQDLKTKETITNISQYPKKEGFSASLMELTISTWRMKSVDIRWFALKFLTTLDLSNNKLGKMEEFEWRKFNRISKLNSLTTLDLTNNGFTELPWDFVHAIPKTLEVLSLSANSLTYLPDEICDLRELRMFSADNNPLTDLPPDFFHKCNYLKFLNVSGTKIETHPAILRQFRLNFLSSNAIGHPFQNLQQPKREVGSLFSFAAAKIYDNRDLFFWLPYNVRFRMRCELFRCDQCQILYSDACKKTVLIQPIPPTSIAESVSADQGTRMQINLLDSTCAKCYNNYARYHTQ